MTGTAKPEDMRKALEKLTKAQIITWVMQRAPVYTAHDLRRLRGLAADRDLAAVRARIERHEKDAERHARAGNFGLAKKSRERADRLFRRELALFEQAFIS